MRLPGTGNALAPRHSCSGAINQFPNLTRKLIVRAEGFPSEFYDLEKDPGEATNRIDDPAYAKEITALRTELTNWFQKAGAPPIGDWTKTTRQHLTEYGPFPTLAEAVTDMQTTGESGYEPGETLAEAEDEIGMSDWIDPDTGEPAEDSIPRTEDH